MQTVSCPSCGAQVQFRSHASVMAVCEYCKTTVLKDADSVKDLGKMSDVLEDYSPIQIGTSGVYGSKGFTVIGRIQLRYPAGMWNEWHLLFDDGGTAWLGDASGQYMLTVEKAVEGQLPSFEKLVPADAYTIAGKSYAVADVRTAQCTGGQGELPFRVGAGWQARVADLRCSTQFLTLDYSDAGQIKTYTGQVVTLEELKCQLLRDDESIKESAGRFRGKVAALSCPSCGSTVNHLPGMTTHIVCPSCHAQLDTTGSVAQVLAAGAIVARRAATLELGAQATINGRPHTLIGFMRRRDEEGTAWVEYLLYNARTGFSWLVETGEGWFFATVQNTWPVWSGDTATIGNGSFRKQCDYMSEVTFAAGAFNWRVAVGDRTRVIEFERANSTLAAEITSEEATWSLSTPVSDDQVRAWFGKNVQPARQTKAGDAEELRDVAGKIIKYLLIVNGMPLLFAFGSTWHYLLIAVAAIYLPAWYLDSSEGNGL